MPGAAGLLLVGVVDLCALGQLLAIGDLRRADARIDLIGAAQNIDLDVEMQFAHALQDGLAGFLIGRNAEGRVFRRKLGERDAELLLVCLRLRLNRDFDDGLRKLHLLQNDRLKRIAQGVAGAGILQARERDNVARKRFLDILAIVRMHQAACDRRALSCPSWS